MANVLHITFNGDCEDGDILRYRYALGANTVTRTYTFKDEPTMAVDVQISTTPNTQAQNFYNTFIADVRNDGIMNISVLGNVVTISTLSGNDIFDTFEDSDGIFISSDVVDVIVSGLESNYYYINNPIIVTIGSGAPLEFYSVSIRNNSNQKSTSKITLYPRQNGFVKFDIAPYIKSIFDYPQNIVPNSGTVTSMLNEYEISIDNPFTQENILTLTKKFVRGGEFLDASQQTNFRSRVGSTLRVTPRLPHFSGYRFADYIINDGVMQKIPLQETTGVDTRRIRGCNNVFVEFANQNGGYSNWMFESFEKEMSSQSKGGYIRDWKTNDLGVDADFELVVFSKVPREYIPLMQHLILSPDIKMYPLGIESGNGTRLRLDKNSIKTENESTGWRVEVKFIIDKQFNPSLLC